MPDPVRIAVDNQTLLVTFGEMPQGFRANVVQRLPVAFKNAQNHLEKALGVLSGAASKPVDRVPRVLRHALHLYFGQPSQPSPQQGVLYTKALMEIIGRLSRTRQYLAQREIAIADISDMPVAMCAQVAAMNFVSMLMKRNPLEFKGYVWSGLLEQAQVALSQSSVDPIAKPVLEGAIHLKLEDFKAATMMREQTLTLIHEATHKFGGTVDHQYFPDDSMLQKYEAKALKLSAKSHLSGEQLAPDDPGIEARARQKLEQDPETKMALQNVAMKQPQDLLLNADSYAHLVMDIAEYF